MDWLLFSDHHNQSLSILFLIETLFLMLLWKMGMEKWCVVVSFIRHYRSLPNYDAFSEPRECEKGPLCHLKCFMGLQFFLLLNMLSTQSYIFVFLSDFQALFWFKSKFVMLIWLTVWFMVCDSKTIKQRLYNLYGNNERGNILPEPRPLIKRPDNLLVVF